MAKAVNQNDLVDIIKAQIESLSDIMTVVFTAANKTGQVGGNVEKNMKTFQQNVDVVFGDNGVLELIKNITDLDKVKPIGRKQRRKVKKAVKSAIKLVKSIAKMLPKKKIDVDITALKEDLDNVYTITISLSRVLRVIRSLKTRGVTKKLRQVRKIFRPLQSVINRINKLKGTRQAQKKAKRVESTVVAIKNIVLTLIIMAPLLAIMILLAPLLMIGFLVLVLVLKVMNILLRLVSKKMILQLTVLSLIFVVLCIMAMTLIVLGMLAIPLLTMLPQIGLFFLALCVVMLAMAAVGWVMSFLTPYMTPFLIGLGTLILMIAGLLIIALMLEEIGKLNLDEKKIKDNVKKVIRCIFSIAEAIFESSYEAAGGSKDDGIFSKLFKAAVGFLGTYLAIYATAQLLVYAVVVVALIFIIAECLSYIQKIDLDPKAVEENVKTVMETVLGIVNMMFFGEMKRPKKAEEAWYKPVLDYGVGLDVAVLEVVGAILAVAYLAIMVVAMLLVLALVGILKAIECIELDPKKIDEQVQNVFDCCRTALNACMGIGEKSETEKSDKTFVKSLVEFALEHTGLGIFKLVLNIIQAILVMAYVAVMVVAMLLILALAGILLAIGAIKITPEDVNATVENVFDCCRAALNACMGIGENTETESSDKSWLGSLISWAAESYGGVMSTMISIVQAILAVAYVAVMIVAMLLILALVGILKLIECIELDAELIKSNVNTCITTCTYINELISGKNPQKAGGGSEGFWATIMEWGSSLVGNIGAIISALMNIMFIALSIVNVFLIMILFGELKLLNEVSLDDKRVKGKVKTCITTATYINDLLADARAKKKEKNKEGGFLGFLKNMFPAAAAVAEFIANYAFLSSALSSIGMIMLLFKELKELNSVKLDAGRIKNNVNTVISTASWLEYRLYEVTHYTSGKSEGKEKDLIVKGINVFGRWLDRAYRPMVNQLYELHSLLKGLITRGLSEEDRKNIEVNVQSIIDMATNITNYINNKNFNYNKAFKNVDLFARLGRVLKTFNTISKEGVENSKEMVANCVGLLDRIDTMNFQKLDKAATMFKAFAVLAHSIKGNFDGLANTINENIMPVLEETQDLLKKLPAELEEAGIRMSNSMNSAVSRLHSSLTEAMNKYQQSVEQVINPTSSDNTTPDGTDNVAAPTDSEWKSKVYKDAKERWQYEGLQDIVDILTGHADHGGKGLKTQGGGGLFG